MTKRLMEMKRKQYDIFLQKIQQLKMSELWGNEADEAWGN